mmetsp:Transcript_37344/g.80588  ORF Transcript_37344/g.80588 Transcript_37344/m.80588 type:complete len:441 (+) Transcript_37344:53-1375(+)
MMCRIILVLNLLSLIIPVLVEARTQNQYPWDTDIQNPPDDCDIRISTLISFDVDASGGLSKDEFFSFLSSRNSDSSTGSLGWEALVAYYAMACYCHMLGRGEGCCGGSAEIIIDDGILSETNSNYNEMLCQQIDHVLKLKNRVDTIAPSTSPAAVTYVAESPGLGLTTSSSSGAAVASYPSAPVATNHVTTTTPSSPVVTEEYDTPVTTSSMITTTTTTIPTDTESFTTIIAVNNTVTSSPSVMAEIIVGADNNSATPCVVEKDHSALAIVLGAISAALIAVLVGLIVARRRKLRKKSLAIEEAAAQEDCDFRWTAEEQGYGEVGGDANGRSGGGKRLARRTLALQRKRRARWAMLLSCVPLLLASISLGVILARDSKREGTIASGCDDNVAEQIETNQTLALALVEPSLLASSATTPTPPRILDRGLRIVSPAPTSSPP